MQHRSVLALDSTETEGDREGPYDNAKCTFFTFLKLSPIILLNEDYIVYNIKSISLR